jgi:hypothetical protein
VFRETKGKVYGLTFIDNKQGCVFNGRDLGKEYSGQSLIHRLQDIKTGEKEKLDVAFGFKKQQSSQHQQADWMNGVPKMVFDLMKAERPYEDPPNPQFKRRTRKKRKRKGLSL